MLKEKYRSSREKAFKTKRMIPPKEPESGVQAAILDYLVLKKEFHYRQNTGAHRTDRGGLVRYGAVGSPDIVIVKNGIYIGVECKSKRGIQSDSQRTFELNLKDAGGIYLLVNSLDMFITKYKALCLDLASTQKK